MKPQCSAVFVQFLTGSKQSRQIYFGPITLPLTKRLHLNLQLHSQLKHWHVSTSHENLILVISWLILRPCYSSLRTNNSKICGQCQEGGVPLVGKNSPTMGLTALFFCCLRAVVTRAGGDSEVRRRGEAKLSSRQLGGIGFWQSSTGLCV